MASRVLAPAVLCLLVIIGSTVVGGYIWPKKDTYATRWDKVNTDEILECKRLLKYYFNCLMGSGPCPPDGRELKNALPEALATSCAKCTQSQIAGAAKVMKFLREIEPDMWEPLAEKYDPDGKYRQKYLGLSTDNNTT